MDLGRSVFRWAKGGRVRDKDTTDIYIYVYMYINIVESTYMYICVNLMIYTEIEDYDTLIKCYIWYSQNMTMTSWQKRHDKVKISTKVFGKHHLTRQGSSEVRLGGLWQVSWHKFFPALYGWFKQRILWCFLVFPAWRRWYFTSIWSNQNRTLPTTNILRDDKSVLGWNKHE